MSNEPAIPEAPKKSKLKLIIMIIILLLLLVGGAVVFWWFQLREPINASDRSPSANSEMVTENMQSAASTEMGTSTEKQDKESGMQSPNAAPKTVINLVTIPTVTVNLADTDPIRYLKLGMDVEVNTKNAATAIEAQIAKVRDAVIIIVSGKTYNDLATTAGKLTIKNEIATRINQILGAPRVVQIYFTEFVVQ